MKTLDEVIKELENLTTCDGTGYSYIADDDADDALQYLKWYKDLADDSEAFAEWKENPPLTWDELRQMEGKPVWIEMHRKGYQPWSGWEVIDYDGVNDSWMSTYRDDYARFQMGEEWQAYRKERG